MLNLFNDMHQAFGKYGDATVEHRAAHAAWLAAETRLRDAETALEKAREAAVEASCRYAVVKPADDRAVAFVLSAAMAKCGCDPSDDSSRCWGCAARELAPAFAK